MVLFRMTRAKDTIETVKLHPVNAVQKNLKFRIKLLEAIARWN